ncbi:MAG: hypothetical protein ABIC39_07835 [Pseudomonadota bacterium]
MNLIKIKVIKMSGIKKDHFQLAASQVTGRLHLFDAILRIGVFGMLWGLVEAMLGETLKAAYVPFSGAILTGLAALIFLTGRYFVQVQGTIILMSMVAALVKLTATGMVVNCAVSAILMEGLFAEIFVFFLGVNRRSYLITAIMLLLYSVMHPFIYAGFIYGVSSEQIFQRVIAETALLLRLENPQLGLVMPLFLGINILFGLFTGWLAYYFPTFAEKRLSKRSKK